MQKVVYANYGGYSIDPLHEVNKLLSEGWKVVMMQPFSQVVSVSSSGNGYSSENEKGAYGTTFVLEKGM